LHGFQNNCFVEIKIPLSKYPEIEIKVQLRHTNVKMLV